MNEAINSSTCSDMSYESNSIEIVSITVKYNNSELDILGCYKFHSGISGEFLTDPTRSFNKLSLMNEKIILLGTLNVIFFYNSSQREHFMNFMWSYYFVPKTTKPTSFSSDISEVPSLLDQT